MNEPSFVAGDASVPYGCWYGRRCGLIHGRTALSIVVVFTESETQLISEGKSSRYHSCVQCGAPEESKRLVGATQVFILFSLCSGRNSEMLSQSACYIQDA